MPTYILTLKKENERATTLERLNDGLVNEGGKDEHNPITVCEKLAMKIVSKINVKYYANREWRKKNQEESKKKTVERRNVYI